MSLAVVDPTSFYVQEKQVRMYLPLLLILLGKTDEFHAVQKFYEWGVVDLRRSE